VLITVCGDNAIDEVVADYARAKLETEVFRVAIEE
jgi:hypothetical protein